MFNIDPTKIQSRTAHSPAEPKKSTLIIDRPNINNPIQITTQQTILSSSLPSSIYTNTFLSSGPTNDIIEDDLHPGFTNLSIPNSPSMDDGPPGYTKPVRNFSTPGDSLSHGKIVTNNIKLSNNGSNLINNNFIFNNSDNDQSPSSFVPQEKPDSSKYPKLEQVSTQSAVYSLAQSIATQRREIENILISEMNICEFKLNEFKDKITLRNKEVESLLTDLSQKVSECAMTQKKEGRNDIEFDIIVDSRSDDSIFDFLKEREPDEVFCPEKPPKKETVANLLPFLCRFFKKDKKLAFLWTEKALHSIDATAEQVKPALLEVKRVMTTSNELCDEAMIIANIIKSKFNL